MSAARDTISGKIDHLFRTILRNDGREFTYDDVERGTRGRVSRSYVWKLRHGRNTNPSLEVLEALAEFFQVAPSYFFSSDERGEARAKEAAEVAALLRDPAVRSVAQRARGLSGESVHALEQLIESLHVLEGAARKRSAA